MAPTPSSVGSLVPQGVSVSSSSPQTAHVVIPVSQNEPAGGSSTTQKQPIDGISTSRNTHQAGSGNTQKLSTVGISTTTTANLVVRSSTPKPIVVGISTLQSNPPSVQVTNATLSTTRRIPVVGGQSPGGIHPNYSTPLPPISQGQHGTTSGGAEGANTSTIIAGVLVPLILVGVGVLIFYIWYRRKFPVRMVLGRDFSRFSNPAYNKRASTLTLVRNDGQTAWDTLSRRNPDLSTMNEVEPGGTDNQAFESDEDENSRNSTAEKRVEVEVEAMAASATDGIENGDKEDIMPNIGISRERPKTKKAVLVKTDTMEDFENGFELVTESDLGQRTESEVSSGNDSTETHTISLTFSETFDDRHKDTLNKTNTDVSEGKTEHLDETDNGNNDSSEKETDSSVSTLDEANVLSESIKENSIVNDDDLDEKRMGYQNNESFEIITNQQLDDTGQEKQTGIENDVGSVQLPTEVLSEEEIPNGKYEQFAESNVLESSGNIGISDSGVIETSSSPPLNETNELPIKVDDSEKEEGEEEGDDYDKHQESLELPQGSGNEKTVNREEKCRYEASADNRSYDIKAEDKAYQNQSEPYKHDNSFEVLPDSEEVKTGNIYLNQSPNENQGYMTQNKMDISPKERTEMPEKQKTLEGHTNLQVTSYEENQNEHSEVSTDENESQKLLAQSKKPSLTLSNENIVLDSVPQTPTVLVQESFILENESPLPVYLDSTNMSPVRGRRAFTLNDIVSNNNANDLPTGKDEISKSSPVISELKALEFKSFDKKHFDLDSRIIKDIDVNEDAAKDISDKVFNDDEIKTAERNINKTEERKNDSIFSEAPETVEITDMKDKMSVSDAFESQERYELETNTLLQKDDCKDEMFTSLDSDSFEFDREKSNDFKLETSEEITNFNDIATDPFNLIQDNGTLDVKTEHEPTQSAHIDNDTDKLDTLDVFTTNVSIAEVFENNSEDTREKTKDTGEIATENLIDEENLFFGNFPQSSTPTASIVAALTSSDSDLKRKKVLPQAFDFENLSDNDSYSAKSETSSETNEAEVNNAITSVGDIGEYNKSFGAFDTERLDNPNQNTDLFEEKSTSTQQTEASFMTDDMSGLTRSTDSSTALSWEMLSRENSQDSRSNDHFDIKMKEENVPELFNFSVNKTQNNESSSVLTHMSENAGVFDFIPDVSKGSPSNNTSMGSSVTTDISWEIVNEEGENSEC